MNNKNLTIRGNVGMLILLFGLLFSIVLFQNTWAGENSSGSMELHLPKELSQGVELTIYQVGHIEGEELILSDPYKDLPLSLQDLLADQSDAIEKAAEQLYILAKNAGAEGVKGTAQEDGIVIFSNLEAALYLVVQTAGEGVTVQKTLISIPYQNVNGQPTYDPRLMLKYDVAEGQVTLNKVDDEEEPKPVVNAEFILQRKQYILSDEILPEGMETGSDSGGSYAWMEVKGDLKTDENGQIIVKPLLKGTYRFVEKKQPGGYYMTEDPGFFQITDEDKEIAVTMVDGQTRIRILKVDEDDDPLAQAKLVIKDSEGKVILNEDGTAKYMFLSKTDGVEITKLPIGSYFLSELEAPEGYELASDVNFEITEDIEEAIEVFMVDTKKGVIPDAGQITVIKNLQDLDGNLLTARDAEFYVALFADEAGTERISAVKTLVYKDTSSSRVVFDNIDPNAETVYYVFETTEYGEVLESGYMGEASFAAVYENGQEVGITPQNKNAELEFSNVFLDLPEGFYYDGDLTIVKTLKYTTLPDNVGPFYATVFDEEGEKITTVTLSANDGAGDTKVVEDLYIGEEVGSSRTYTVKETDANGVPLDESAQVFEITISSDTGDGGTVELRSNHQDANITITNTWKEVTPTVTPTTSVTPTVTPGTPSYGGGGGGGGSTSTSNVRTGDNTPIGALLAVLAAAVAVIVAVLFLKKKKG